MDIKLFRKGDFAVILAVLIVALAFFAWKNIGSDKKEAVITVDGEIIETVDLQAITEKKTIKIGDEAVIVAENGAVYFESAKCEDKLCVACGKLTEKGDTAVCLPAKTVVTVAGKKVDAVTY